MKKTGGKNFNIKLSPGIKAILYGGALVETFFVVGSIWLYRRYRSEDFRRYANDTKDLKWTLEIYYRIGELMNKEYNGRALDKEAWGIVDPPKEN